MACYSVGIIDSSIIDTFLETALSSPSKISQSNLTLFHYNIAKRPVLEFVHCPYHSDIGLVTIIPRCKGLGGLHIYDMELDKWIDVEKNSPPNCAVIFGGESLCRLTNNYYLPGFHEVSHIEGERFSVALQSLAKPKATFDYDLLDKQIVGDCYENFKHVIQAEVFVNAVSATRISSNFPFCALKINK